MEAEVGNNHKRLVQQSATPKTDRLNTTGSLFLGENMPSKFVKGGDFRRKGNSTMNIIDGAGVSPTMAGSSYRNFLGMTGTGVFSKKANFKAAEDCPYNTSTSK